MPPQTDEPGSLLTDTPPAPPAPGTPPPAPSAGETPPAPPPGDPPPPGETDWLPEKFRVMKDDKLDEAASARKLAESYKALEQHKGPLPPASPDEYTIAPLTDAEGKPVDGVNVDEFTADPMYKSFAAEAHKLGFSNEQMQFVVHRYLATIPELFTANQQLSLQEAQAELSNLWGSEQAFNANIAASIKAVRGFGAEAEDVPGSRARIEKKFGTDPDFIAFAARIGAELKEDTPPGGLSQPSDLDIESLQKSPAYWDKSHPDHAATNMRVKRYYAEKHGTAARGRRT